MLVEFIKNNMFVSSIVAVGVLSIFLQWLMMLSLRGYVKASANMKTTKKKVMLNLKNQFEAMYDMNSKVRNMDAYVEKYLLKLRFLGFTYSSWEKLPFLTAGMVIILAAMGAFYGYVGHASNEYYVDISFVSGITLACLFLFFHIFGIKMRKQQIHIQLVDYLENYLANRLAKTRETKNQLDMSDEEIDQAYIEGKNDAINEINSGSLHDTSENAGSTAEEDMDMLKRLLKEMDGRRREGVSGEVAAASEEQSDIELLEEFVQSFLA